MEISKYKPEYEDEILTAINKDPAWDLFTNDDTTGIYKDSFKDSVTYVCHEKNEFCGYVRALLDDGLAIYISDLYVPPKWRNRKVGRSLLEKIKTDFSSITVHALSDEDTYY